ncbi:YafY family protein [Dechloromonas sp. ZY10]|uniref:helix-turn-helix transcriptional regulator n=1 Tax=Dechloromonas aquae TaxID=2664436 RepID=UPI003526D626
MSRAERLLQLMQTLRRHRQPIAGQALASELGVSLRTLYRDIATLQGQGAHIEGEAGLGYILRPGFVLPPLMFSADEIEALVLGSRWVAERGDPRLGEAAKNALAKITAVLPPELRHEAESSALLVGPENQASPVDQLLFQVRTAIRAERKLQVGYRDVQGAESLRTVWPCAVGFFDRCLVMVAWCELREDFRHFRIDRIARLSIEEARYPERRQALLRRWRQQEGIPGQ